MRRSHAVKTAVRAIALSLSLSLLLLLAMSATTALAAADPQQLTLRDIVAQQTQLRAQALAGAGVFRDVDKRERKALVQRQDRVLKALRGLDTLADMPPDRRTDVFNDLEWIKAAITHAEDARLVCEFTRTTGSNITRTVCTTAAAQRGFKEGAQESLRKVYKCDNCAGD